jgi:hypothetical protein
LKSSILVCQLDSGALHSVASPTFAEAADALARVRKDRTVEVGKKSVGVEYAVIITQNALSAQVVKSVNVGAEARREQAVKAAAKAEASAKAKAEESKK